MTCSRTQIASSLFALALSASPLAAQAECPQQFVTGYYAGYAAFSPDYQDPRHVDFTQMTHFVYARVYPGSGAQVAQILPGNLEADRSRALGPGAPTRSIQEYLVARAHQVGKKALIMIGGNTNEDREGFRQSLAPAYRATFVSNLLDYMSAYGYDGVDLDFEGFLTTDDETLLRALVTDLRAAAATHHRFAQSGILITFPSGMKNLNIESVTAHDLWMVAHVDQYNLMSYGAGAYGSGWSSHFHSPLTGEVSSRPMSIASTVDLFAAAGANRCKIGMGIGFYGLAYMPPYTGPGQFPTERELDPSKRSADDAQWNYAQLRKKGYLDNGNYVWDAATQTGYRVYDGWAPSRTDAPVGYISYEDEAGIAAKGAYSRGVAGAGGTIVWLVNYGSDNGVNNPMMLAVARAFLDPNASDKGADPNPGTLPPLPDDAPAPPPPPPAPAPVPRELLSYSFGPHDSDWDEGYCGSLQVSYSAAGTASGAWTLDSVPMRDAIFAFWNGRYTVLNSESINVESPLDNPWISPGETKTVGFCAKRSAPPPSPPPAAPADLSTSHVTIDASWNGGANWCGTVHLINTGGTPAHLWNVTLPLPKGEQAINNWGGGDIAWSQSGANLTIRANASGTWQDVAIGGAASQRTIGICRL